MLRAPTNWVDDSAVELAGDKFGTELVMAKLAERAEQDPSIRAYRDAVVEKVKRKAQRVPAPEKTLDEVLAAIERDQDRCIWLMRWARKARREDLNALFEHLLQENRPTQQARYLRAFAREEMPRVADKVFELARSADEDVRWQATRSLSKMQDIRIREFALRLLKSTPPRMDAVQLLARNYKQGDHQLVDSVLVTEGDDDSVHATILDLLELSKNAKDPDLAQTLFRFYDVSPCAICRQGVVEELVNVGRAPQEMLQECLWDSYEDTRKLARSSLGSSEGVP